MVALYNELREGVLMELNAAGLLKTDDPDYQNKSNSMTTKAVNHLKDYLCETAVDLLREELEPSPPSDMAAVHEAPRKGGNGS